MKKLSFVSGLLVLCISLHAQLTFTTTQVTDTLHYYYQKVNHISGGKPFGKLAYIPGPSLNNLTHVGSRFECKDTVTVFGLECFTAFSSLRTSQASMDIFLYLCNLDANGLPVLPEIDIVKIKINKDTNTVKVG